MVLITTSECIEDYSSTSNVSALKRRLVDEVAADYIRHWMDAVKLVLIEKSNTHIVFSATNIKRDSVYYRVERYPDDLGFYNVEKTTSLDEACWEWDDAFDLSDPNIP